MSKSVIRKPPFGTDASLIQRLIGRFRAERQKPPQELKAFLEELGEAIAFKRLTVFVGAGLSYGSGFPTWSGLLSNIADELVQDRDHAAFQLLADYDGPLISCRYLKTRLAVPDTFHCYVRDALYSREVDYDAANPTLGFIVALVRWCDLEGVFLNVITYNFDDLLETTISARLPSLSFESISSSGAYYNKTNRIRILHVHGYLDRHTGATVLPPPDLVISEEDFHKLMSDTGAWQNQVQTAALAYQDCLFVGMSMTDPNLRRIIDFAEGVRQSQAVRKKWIITRQYRAGDQLDPKAPPMTEAVAAVLNEMKSELFQSLGAKAIYVRDFADYDLLASLIKRI